MMVFTKIKGFWYILGMSLGKKIKIEIKRERNMEQRLRYRIWVKGKN